MSNYNSRRNDSLVFKMVLMGLFAALTAVGAYIRIPLPAIPFTLQFLFCALSGIILGSKLGFGSQLTYVLVGLAGFPIFTKGGGPGYVFQVTFGYLIGFIIAGYAIGKFMEWKKDEKISTVFTASVIGLAIVYLIGVPYFYMAMKYFNGNPMPWNWIIYHGFLASIGGDLATCVIIALVSPKILRSLRKAGYNFRK